MNFYTSVIQLGNNILYRGYENGRQVMTKVQYSPTLFMKSNKKTGQKSLFGDYVEETKFTDISEAKDFIKRYEDVDGFDIFGMNQFNYQFIADNFTNEIKWNLNDMTVYSLDIETASENGFASPDIASEQILLISIQDKATKKIIVWGFRDYDKQQEDNFEYRQYKDEYTMLKEFINFWQGNYPDIITGWNIDNFDIPYLINRITRILSEDFAKKLSPWNRLSNREVEQYGRKSVVWDIVGVNNLDYLAVYKKFTQASRESYTLGFITQLELGETKLELEGSFKDAYTNQWNLFVQYNAKDTELVDKLDDKMKYIELMCTIAYIAKCNIKDVFGPVKTWDVFIYNYLREKNVVIPPHKKKISADFEGAWVKEPVPGMYGWTVSLDFASLYPSIIRQWNMSPETIIGVKENTSINSFICENVDTPEDYTIAANGSMYRKDIHGIIPEVIKVVIDGRKIAKKAMQELEKNNGSDNEIASLNGKQLAFKVLANALYGALSNIGFRYYDLRIAEAITLTGQASDRHVEKTLNEYMNKILKTENKDYVTYGDTDSIYLNVQPLVDSFCADKSIDDTVKFLDKVCDTKIQEQVNKSVDRIFEIGNCYEKIMDMKREVIASRAIWTAKKRYAMMVHNSEGIDYKPYKLKIMGLDLIKSSTPQEIRKLLKESLVTIFEKDESELQKFVSQVKQKFMKMSVENIAFPRSANDLEKYHNDKSIYGSKCPVQVRGALLYNHYLKSNNDIVKIKSGDKIKFVYLKIPNKIREDVISFPSHSSLPKELDLHKYINYELMWEKVFLSPLKGITDAIDWSPEKRATLDALFG